MQWTDFEKSLLALVIWREARGEPREGQRAVAHVIRNRVKAGWNTGDWAKVIEGHNQFSSMTVAGDSQLIRWPSPPDANFEQIMAFVDGIYDGTDEDITGGALYYANLAVATSHWFLQEIAEKMPVTATIGAHTFYAPQKKPAAATA